MEAMDENAELPEMVERLHGRPVVPYQTEQEWRLEVLVLLRGICECLLRAPWMQAVSSELPEASEPVVVATEPSGDEEPLPTWILTDEQVSRVEGAVQSEQRVRGRAYGG